MSNSEFESPERHYEVLFERALLPMWVYDAESLRFLRVNEAAERLAGALRGPSGPMPHEALSAREFEVLRMMASGKTQAQIAGELRLA